jgi:hypothetical protein
MTIDALPGKGRRSRSSASEALPIGEADANIFDCPACHRPLGVGTRRCPGCGTRLLSGGRATTALGYLAGGLIVGLLVGGGAVGLAMTLSASATVVSDTTPVASAVPNTSAAPVATAAPAIAPTVPTAAVSALRQTTALDQRLVTDAGRLAAVLAVRDPSTADLARILRSLSANASFGNRLTPALADWPTAAPLSISLTEVYAAVATTAQDGLDASLTNERAYLRASQRMLVLIDGLIALDAEARALAAQAGLDLPDLTTP